MYGLGADNTWNDKPDGVVPSVPVPVINYDPDQRPSSSRYCSARIASSAFYTDLLEVRNWGALVIRNDSLALFTTDEILFDK